VLYRDLVASRALGLAVGATDQCLYRFTIGAAHGGADADGHGQTRLHKNPVVPQSVERNRQWY